MGLIEEKFSGIFFGSQDLSRDGYDECIFENCTFSAADFSEVSFRECHFKICNFAEAKLDNVGFKDVVFHECNFIGVDFSVCSLFLLKMNFHNCQMDLSSFQGMDLRGIMFKECSLREADFTNAKLKNVSFDKSDLHRTIFHNTTLENTDFRAANHYAFDPSKNILKKSKFSKNDISGLLNHLDIIIE